MKRLKSVKDYLVDKFNDFMDGNLDKTDMLAYRVIGAALLIYVVYFVVSKVL